MAVADKYSTIEIGDYGHWSRLTLSRPEKLNSIDAQMKAELQEALGRLCGDDSVRALLLTGSGRGFCAGQDLGERSISVDGGPPDLGASLRDDYNPLVNLLATCPKPVVCAVNGVAAGAGANLALACDFVIAAQSASFVQAFCKIGLVPDTGGTWLLPRLIGPARARALAMLGNKLDALTATDWGLIHQCVADDVLEQAAIDLTEKLAEGPTAALGRIKSLLREATANSFEEQLELEASNQAEAGRSADYAEGVSAFLEKRAPVFKGK